MYTYAITITSISKHAIKNYSKAELEYIIKQIESLSHGSVEQTAIGYELKNNNALHAHIVLHTPRKPWFPRIYNIDKKNIQIFIGNDGKPLPEDAIPYWRKYCQKYQKLMQHQLWWYKHCHMFVREDPTEGETIVTPSPV